MKQLLLAISLASISLINAYSQTTNSIVIFAEDPKPFYAIVNGIKQNIEPQTNVKIAGLTNPSASVKIVFKDGSPDLNKSIWFEKMGKETTFRIVNTKKGYKLRMFGEVDIVNSVENPSQTTIVYQTVEPKPAVSVTEQVVTTTTTTNPKQPTSTSQSENVNVGINVGGFGVSMNVNVNETGNVGSSSTTTTNGNTEYSSTTTTTSTTTTSGVNYGNETGTDVVVVAPVEYVSGYSGTVGCPIPESSVNSIKSAVEDESFSDDKMSVAKQAIKNRCVTVSQVREIMSAFDYEDKKLEFAKFAYDRTYDVDNYYLVNKDFDFGDTKSLLNKYLETK